MKSYSEAQQGRDRPVDLKAAGIGMIDARQDFEQGALPRAVAPDDPQCRTLLYREADMLEDFEVAPLFVEAFWAEVPPIEQGLF
jgi:hypothetical protein